MPALHRKLVLVAAGGIIAMGAIFVACGLDENGIVAGDDASVAGDVAGDTFIVPDVQVDNFIPLPDAAIDASCFDASVPDGWIAVGIKATDNVTCPGQPSDYLVKQYVTNPVPDVDSCQCTGCAPTGAWTCNAALSTGTSCNTALGNATGPGCTNGGGFHYSATTQRAGDAGCTPVQAGGTNDASASPIGACIPQTGQADFCGLTGQGFDLCILNTNVTDGGCPPGFPTATLAGVQAAAACSPCTCGFSNPNAPCSGTVSAFTGQNCDDGGELSTQAADGGCVNTAGFASVYFAPNTPTPACAPSTSTSQGILLGPLTICCP